jgi:hypothetical protein
MQKCFCAMLSWLCGTCGFLCFPLGAWDGFWKPFSIWEEHVLPWSLFPKQNLLPQLPLAFLCSRLGALHILILLFGACNVVQPEKKVQPFAHNAFCVSEPHDVHWCLVEIV